MKNTLLTSLLCVSLLSGCSSINKIIDGSSESGVREVGNTSSIMGFVDHAKNTWGREKPRQVSLTKVQFKMTMPAHIIMQKQAIGETPIITKTDKRESLLAAKGLMKVMDIGLRKKFEEKAVAYGLTITPVAADIIHVNIQSINSFCEAYKGCRTKLGIDVKVTDIYNNVVWKYNGSIEQSQPKEIVNEPLFDNFADLLLESMKNDFLIGR